jgi:CRISPR-associated protein Csb2
MTGGYRDKWNEIEPALLWLETQKSPEIEAVDAVLETPYRIAVPNNDMDVVASEWRKGNWSDPTKLNTLKSVRPWKVTGTGPHLQYRWPQVEMDEATATGLRLAAECLHTLGWGIDAAFASMLFGSETLGASKGMVKWRPMRKGSQTLAIPTAGSLTDLRESYGRFLSAVTQKDVNPDTRPMVFHEERYGSGTETAGTLFFDLQKPDGSRFSYSAGLGMRVAAWMRHAVSQALLEEQCPTDWVNAVALGHGEAEGRLSYVPMPSVGHPSAGGRIQRVMVARDPCPEDGTLAMLAKKLTGRVLTDEFGKETCRLVAPADNTTVRKFYIAANKQWRTVTPVVLHGFNSQRGAVSLRKTERLLLQAFENAGWDLTKIESVAFQSAPFFNGADAARDFRVPKHLDGFPRFHVAVDFRDAVGGPLLAGLGRRYGIGVFAFQPEGVKQTV